MIADEGFVYACATGPEVVEVDFSLGQGSVGMDFSLGTTDPDDESVDLVRVLLSALCDEFRLLRGRRQAAPGARDWRP